MIVTNLLKLGDQLELPGDGTTTPGIHAVDSSQVDDFNDIFLGSSLLPDSPALLEELTSAQSTETNELQSMPPEGKDLPPFPYQEHGAISAIMPLDMEEQFVVRHAGLSTDVPVEEELQAGRLALHSAEIRQVSVSQSGETLHRNTVTESVLMDVVSTPELDSKSLGFDAGKAFSEIVKQDGARLETAKENNGQLPLSGISKAETTENARNILNSAKLSINTPVQNPAWSDSLAGRISWMLSNNQNSAQIQLNPAELGPIEVKIQVQNEQANVNFVASNQATREAILEAFPRLREMLDEQGLNLHQGSVSEQQADERNSAGNFEDSKMIASSLAEHDEDATPSAIQTRVEVLGLIDQFV